MVEVPNRPEYQSELFKQGLAVRREVLGGDYVDASLARADDFNAGTPMVGSGAQGRWCASRGWPDGSFHDSAGDHCAAGDGT